MASLARSGLFEKAADRRVERFSESVSFDHLLSEQDIRGSIAHAQMLADTGQLSAEECQQIVTTLGQIQEEIDEGTFIFQQSLEDVHMNVEQALIDRLGDVGRKLHTARSRNDQVSTDLRLWVRDAIDRLDGGLKRLQEAFVGRCDEDEGVIVPAYTHMQRAQPVLASHYWLAYCEKLQRDRSRLADCRRRANQCSLGGAALAGTTLPIDRQNVADRLGFEGVAANSLDISSDRDFVLELAFVLALVAEHLSGWAEEWILWSTVEFDYLRLPQEFCTGSSIMPQKINPDVLELIRGKTARVIGNLQALLVLVKGLPLAYNRDLQEDKEPIFDSVRTVEAALELAAPMVAGAQLKTESIAARLSQGYLDATTLMEYFIAKGIPQRTAHHAVGVIVRKAVDRSVPLTELSLADFQEAYPECDESVYSILGEANTVAAFASYGSTNPDQVAQQVERWKQQLQQESTCEE